VLAQLARERIEAQACTYSPVGIRLKHKPALNKHPLFLDGVVEVQDEGSQLLPLLVEAKRGNLAAGLNQPAMSGGDLDQPSMARAPRI
jgi:16S rRNA (cytosine967-C5)-methyltransferase